MPSGSRPRSAALCMRRTKGPRSLGSKPSAAALLGRGELRLRSLDSLPWPNQRQDTIPEAIVAQLLHFRDGAKGRQLLGICDAVQRNMTRAGIGRAANGRSSSEKPHCLRSQRLLAQPTWIPPPLPAAADARHRPGVHDLWSLSRTGDRRCQSPVFAGVPVSSPLSCPFFA